MQAVDSFNSKRKRAGSGVLKHVFYAALIFSFTNMTRMLGVPFTNVNFHTRVFGYAVRNSHPQVTR